MVKIDLVVLVNMLTDDARPTTDNDRCQPIAIGHLSESGDLKCDQDCVAITKTQIKTKHYTQKSMFTSMYTESFGNVPVKTRRECS